MKKRALLMLIGGQFHAFDRCAAVFKEQAEASGRYKVEITEDRNALRAENLANYDGVVLYCQGGELTKPQLDGLLGFVRGGGACIGLHSAAASWVKQEAYVEMLGCRFAGHGPVCEFTVAIANRGHMITQRIPAFQVTDELYLLDKHDPAAVNLLATATWQGKPQPIAYTKTYGEGRVFYLALGHDERSFNHPSFQKLALRGIGWCFGLEPRKPLKAGVVGYGGAFNMGRMHLEGLRDGAGFEGVAVCELDADRRKVATEEFPGIETYASLSRMLDKSDVELVVIITPHNTHAKLAQQCLNAGRHVITEKPFCITVKEAGAMINAAHKNKVMLSVFHNRRWDGDYMTIHDIINQGLIGEPFHIELCGGGYGHPRHWWRSDKRISGGAFYDWGAHFVDWVLNLVPAQITEISGYFQDKRVWHDVTNEDHCGAVIRFGNGTCAQIELSHIAAVGKRRWRILGTRGAIEEAGDRFHVVSYQNGAKLDALVDYREGDWMAYYRNIGDHLLLDEPLAVTAESARRVIGVIETAERSSRQGKALPPPKGCA